MSIKRIHWTERRKILREHIEIVLRTDRSLPYFSVDLSLGSYGFPSDARVFVEAYRQTSWMRFDFGTVGRILQPGDTSLTEFKVPDALKFRVKVTVEDEEGLQALIGEADRIPFICDDEALESRNTLLPVKPEDIGDVIWSLKFEEDGPLLLVNERLGNWREHIRSPGFFGLVYPAALREILREAVKREDDDDSWQLDWIRFALQLPNIGPFPKNGETEEKEDWVDDAVKAFSYKCNVFDRYMSESKEDIQ